MEVVEVSLFYSDAVDAACYYYYCCCCCMLVLVLLLENDITTANPCISKRCDYATVVRVCV